MGINTQPSGATSLSQVINGPDASLDVEYRTDPLTGISTISGDAAGAVAVLAKGPRAVSLAVLGDSFLENLMYQEYSLGIPVSITVDAAAYVVSTPGQVSASIPAGRAARIRFAAPHGLPIGYRAAAGLTIGGVVPSGFNATSVDCWVANANELVYQVTSGLTAATDLSSMTSTYVLGYLSHLLLPNFTPGSLTAGARCFVNQLQLRLGGRLSLAGNFAVGGTTTADFLARCDVALASGCNTMLVGPPNNDIRNGVLFETTQANIIAIADKCTKARVTPWFVTVPQSSPITSANPALQRLHSQFNVWLSDWGRLNNFAVIDGYSAYIDQATGLALTNCVQADLIHPADLGANFLDIQAFPVVDGLTPGSLTAGRKSMNLDFDNLLFNGSMVGNNATGTNNWTQGGGSGNGPDGWTTNIVNAGTPVLTTAARTDGPQGRYSQSVATTSAQGGRQGYQQDINLNNIWVASTAVSVGHNSARGRILDTNGNHQIAIVAGTTGATVPTWNTQIGGTTVDGGVTWRCVNRFQGGDSIRMSFEWSLSSVSGGNLGASIDVQILAYKPDTTFIQLLWNAPSDQATAIVRAPADGLFRTATLPPFKLPAGCTQVSTRVYSRADNGVTSTLRLANLHINHA